LPASLNRDEYPHLRASDIMGRGNDLIVLGEFHADSRPMQLLLPLLRHMKQRHGLTHVGFETNDTDALAALNINGIPA